MSRINLSDDADTMAQKIKKAKTDPEPLPSKKPGWTTGPRRAISSASMPRWPGNRLARCCAQFGGQGFGAFKPALAELLVAKLGPIRDRFVALKDDSEALDAILARGAAKARERGKPTLDAAYRALGLVRH